MGRFKRADYKWVADSIRFKIENARPSFNWNVDRLRQSALCFADKFAEDDPAFDRDQFLKDCGLLPDTHKKE